MSRHDAAVLLELAAGWPFHHGGDTDSLTMSLSWPSKV
jgi:hypothetical protein